MSNYDMFINNKNIRTKKLIILDHRLYDGMLSNVCGGNASASHKVIEFPNSNKNYCRELSICYGGNFCS